MLDNLLPFFKNMRGYVAKKRSLRHEWLGLKERQLHIATKEIKSKADIVYPGEVARKKLHKITGGNRTKHVMSESVF